MDKEKQPGKIPLYLPEGKIGIFVFSCLGIAWLLAMSLTLLGSLAGLSDTAMAVIVILLVLCLYGALGMAVAMPLYCYMSAGEQNIEIFLFGRMIRQIPASQIKLICAVGNEMRHNLCVSTLEVEELAHRREEKLEKGVFSRQDLPFRKRRAGWQERFAKEYLLKPKWRDCRVRTEDPIIWLNIDIVSILYLRNRYPYVPYLNLTDGVAERYCPGEPDLLLGTLNSRVAPDLDGLHILKKKQQIGFVPAEEIKAVFRIDSFYSRGRYTSLNIPYLIVSTLPVEEVARQVEKLWIKKWRKPLIAALPQAQKVGASVYLEQAILYGSVKGKLYPMYYTRSNEQKLRQSFPHARWVDVSDLWKYGP